MDTAHRSGFSVSSSLRWSLYAGLYMFICATAVALILSEMLALLADVIGISTEYWMIIFASPAFIIGAVVWWTVVERRGPYTYLLGGVFGLLTASVTGLLWTVQFIRFWGFKMVAVPEVTFLIVFVLGFAAISGALTGVPLMYVRRRLHSDLASGENETG